MPSHLIIMMVERNELLITGALRFSMVDCKISQLLALPAHWVKPCLAQLVSALALAWTLLHQHLGHQAALPSVQLPRTPFSPIRAFVTGAIITTSSNSTNMVELSRGITTISQELSSHTV